MGQVLQCRTYDTVSGSDTCYLLLVFFRVLFPFVSSSIVSSSPWLLFHWHLVGHLKLHHMTFAVIHCSFVSFYSFLLVTFSSHLLIPCCFKQLDDFFLLLNALFWIFYFAKIFSSFPSHLLILLIISPHLLFLSSSPHSPPSSLLDTAAAF